ncbi:MAG: ATP-binding cassette domain-containing protein [Bacilli bacterium]|jgi:putative ABC transport system ATP-binding protein|nr:ATP-binding cassette domain-containing protein [Bacilli bacterium]
MLEVKNLTKIFNKDTENQKVALDHVFVHIEEGEFVTVIGGNGSGKSTFLNLISGIHMPDEGAIFLGGINVAKLPEHRRAKYLGRVFQDPMMGTAANMSILENLFIAKKKGEKKTLHWGFNRDDTALFKEKLRALNLGLEDRLEQKMGLLSGGQRQAITLIMATLEKPKVLLLDEHTAALDPKTAKTVLNLTNTMIEQEKLTTIMITHNMRDAIKYGNRLLMFNNGKIIFDVKGEEKKHLTIEALLAKFETDESVEISDSMVLS